jgi:hypothetical protein
MSAEVLVQNELDLTRCIQIPPLAEDGNFRTIAIDFEKQFFVSAVTNTLAGYGIDRLKLTPEQVKSTQELDRKRSIVNRAVTGEFQGSNAFKMALDSDHSLEKSLTDLGYSDLALFAEGLMGHIQSRWKTSVSGQIENLNELVKEDPNELWVKIVIAGQSDNTARLAHLDSFFLGSNEDGGLIPRVVLTDLDGRPGILSNKVLPFGLYAGRPKEQ